MKIAVRLFARARDLAGTDCLHIELGEGASVAKLKQRLQEQCPPLRPMLTQLLIAVGTEYATNDTVLDETADVACFPPVSGG